ncbi:hypothetical protein C1H76_1385 [Elsinoe australis]|uniref:DUF1772-domain-containing protein n=1 Tax=Elsinoe australis TaxID=40998 RepID=A0A4U7B4Y3_9PEZI|nr:hypothetical protein C1H76_1385 [Elsinoe australis]
MSSTNYHYAAQITGTASSLVAAGAILSISALINPVLDTSARSVSAEKPSPTTTLPAIRFLFSRGSHIFPQAATVAGACFGYLAYNNSGRSGLVKPLQALVGVSLSKGAGYTLAAALSTAIMPLTFVMLPLANNSLREMAELKEKGKASEIDRDELKLYLSRFGALNYLRGYAILAGGVMGLMTMLD